MRDINEIVKIVIITIMVQGPMTFLIQFIDNVIVAYISGMVSIILLLKMYDILIEEEQL